MNIIKRFARWVLREDLLNLDISIRSAERSLKEKNKEQTKDFSVGSVVRLKQDGATFVAETNASPWTIYANPKTIEVW